MEDQQEIQITKIQQETFSTASDLKIEIKAPAPHIPACLRTGMCCTRIYLPFSPARLRQAYEDWYHNKPETVKYEDVCLIYPMLEGTCKGKINDHGVYKYIYGPCKNLGKDEKNLPLCTIHKNKPKMCSGFPFYDHGHVLRMDNKPTQNPSQYRGCGFNQDSSNGITLDEINSQLVPLTEEEK